MLSSSLDTLFKLYKTTFPQKLFPSDCIKLFTFYMMVKMFFFFLLIYTRKEEMRKEWNKNCYTIR